MSVLRVMLRDIWHLLGRMRAHWGAVVTGLVIFAIAVVTLAVVIQAIARATGWSEDVLAWTPLAVWLLTIWIRRARVRATRQETDDE